MALVQASIVRGAHPVLGVIKLEQLITQEVATGVLSNAQPYNRQTLPFYRTFPIVMGMTFTLLVGQV